VTHAEVYDDSHGEIGKLALLNDPGMYELTNAIIEEVAKDKEKIKALIKRPKIT
jgi:hypothetical protein